MITMHDVDLRQLAAVVAVVEEGTYARASKRVGFTQSAISQRFASLEKSAGITVFDRPKGPKPVELTPAGQLVLEYARSALANATDVDARLDRLRRGISGELTIGTFQSVSSKLLPSIIGQMRTEAPHVDVRLIETDDQDHLVRGVLDNDMDLAFTIDQQPDPRIALAVLGHDPFVVIAPAAEATGTTVALAALNDKPLVGQPPNNSCQLMVDDRMRAAGLRPDYAYRLTDNAAVQSMVRSAMGWAVMPSLAVDASDPLITVMEPDPPIAPRVMQLIRRTDRTLIPAADTFARIAHEVTASILTQAAASQSV